MSFSALIVTAISVFLLALTLSADDFSVGVAYGLFKIKIPLKILLITILGSAISTWGVMFISNFIFSAMPNYVSSLISTIILGVIGLKMIYSGWKEELTSSNIVINHPLSSCDSKSISILETFLIGLGLGVDDFAQAIGLTGAGFPIIMTVILLELSELLAILCGNYLAFKGFSKKVNGRLQIIPGIILLIIALYQVIS